MQGHASTSGSTSGLAPTVNMSGTMSSPAVWGNRAAAMSTSTAGSPDDVLASSTEEQLQTFYGRKMGGNQGRIHTTLRINLSGAFLDHHRAYLSLVEDGYRAHRKAEKEAEEDMEEELQTENRGVRARGRRPGQEGRGNGSPVTRRATMATIEKHRQRTAFLGRGETRPAVDVGTPAEVEVELEEELRILAHWKRSMLSQCQTSDGQAMDSGSIGAALAAGTPTDASPSKEELAPQSIAPETFFTTLTMCPSALSMLATPPEDAKKTGAWTSLKRQRGENRGWGQQHVCSVCLLPAVYRCVRCQTALFCSIKCHVAHEATRCLKFTV